jgi:diguanylate cyclase (GGDEF)-like protein
MSEAANSSHVDSSGLRALFSRPERVSAGARWLFLWFLVALTAFVSAQIVVTATDGFRLLAVVSTVGLYVLWGLGYLRGQTGLWVSVADAVGLLGIALACQDPHTVFYVLFGAVWFRSLVGTSGQAVARGVLYTAAVVGTIALWPVLHPSAAPLDILSFAGGLPILVASLLVVWKLGQTLSLRDESMARDRILAATGSRFLGTTDGATIHSLAWNVMEQFCAVTPGLLVLQVQESDDGLTITGSAGFAGSLPRTLPSTVLTSPNDGTPARVFEPRPVNLVVGVPRMWECLALDESDDWLLVGAPGAVPREAILSIHGLIGQLSLAIRNSRAHHELATQARTDPLTGLDNRGSFTRQVSRDLGDSANRAGLRVLFLDLDDFKNVNDERGHRVGDELLAIVGARLRRGARVSDLCARLGGDEFAVVLHDTSDQQAVDLAERLVAALAEPFVFDGHTFAIGVSVGISSAQEANDLEDLLHQADVAMYAAKAGGKGRVVVFEPGLLRLGRTHASTARGRAD